MAKLESRGISFKAKYQYGVISLFFIWNHSVLNIIVSYFNSVKKHVIKYLSDILNINKTYKQLMLISKDLFSNGPHITMMAI